MTTYNLGPLYCFQYKAYALYKLKIMLYSITRQKTYCTVNLIETKQLTSSCSGVNVAAITQLSLTSTNDLRFALHSATGAYCSAKLAVVECCWLLAGSLLRLHRVLVNRETALPNTYFLRRRKYLKVARSRTYGGCSKPSA